MINGRTQRRLSDPGLQPERTSLAWFRTFLGYGALIALALYQHHRHIGLLLWLTLALLTLVGLMIYRYARQRNLMDVAIADFVDQRTIRAKLLITLAVLCLTLLFTITHLHQIWLLLEPHYSTLSIG